MWRYDIIIPRGHEVAYRIGEIAMLSFSGRLIVNQYSVQHNKSLVVNASSQSVHNMLHLGSGA